jgi:probable HAF family extracellular repeat protein
MARLLVATLVLVGVIAGGVPPARAGDDYVVTALGALPGDLYSRATALNDRGQVVGAAWAASGEMRATLWQGGDVIDLHAFLPATAGVARSEATGINTVGQIAIIAGSRSYLLTPASPPGLPGTGGGGGGDGAWSGGGAALAVGLAVLLGARLGRREQRGLGRPGRVCREVRRAHTGCARALRALATSPVS